MKKINSIVGNREFGYKILQWKVISHCNLSCPYCIVEAPSKSYEICENYKDIVTYLNTVLKTSKYYTIPRLYGGEPTLHPNFWDICNSFQVPFGLYTNMSQNVDFYKECLRFNNLQYYYCSLHYHATTIEEFIKKISLFKDKQVHVNIMLENGYFKELKRIFLYLQSSFPTYRISIKIIDKIPNYYDDNYFLFEEYLHKDQFYKVNNKVISRFNIVQDKYNTISNLFNTDYRYFCNINKYFNYMDLQGNLYNCIDTTTKVTDVYDDIENYSKLELDNLICYYRVCCPYLFEYGIKRRM